MTHISGKNRTSHTSRNEHCVTTKQALVGPSLHCRPFLKEFRVVGQICREGMQGWQWYPAESTICNDRISLPGAAGCVGAAISPPVGPGQSPGGGPGDKAPGSSSDPAVHSTKKCPQKATFLVNLYLCAAYKLKGKIHLNWKSLCARQIIQPHARWTSRSASHGNTKSQTA